MYQARNRCSQESDGTTQTYRDPVTGARKPKDFPLFAIPLLIQAAPILHGTADGVRQIRLAIDVREKSQLVKLKGSRKLFEDPTRLAARNAQCAKKLSVKRD